MTARPFILIHHAELFRALELWRASSSSLIAWWPKPMSIRVCAESTVCIARGHLLAHPILSNPAIDDGVHNIHRAASD